MTTPALRIVFLTQMPAPAVNAIIETCERLGHRVPLVVTTPGAGGHRQAACAELVAGLRLGMDALISRHPRALPALLSGLEPDLLLVTGYAWRLPAELLALPRLGCVNGHPALLPAYRGPNPVYWQIANGEPVIGLTYHRMEADFDTGAILAQGSVPLDSEDEMGTIMPKLLTLGLSLLPSVLESVAAGDPGTPQSAADATYARICTEEDRRMRWERPATELRNQVRAWGAQGACAEAAGQRWRVRRARVVAPSPDPAASPGTVLAQTPDGPLIQTGADALLLTDATAEPGEDTPQQ